MTWRPAAEKPPDSRRLDGRQRHASHRPRAESPCLLAALLVLLAGPACHGSPLTRTESQGQIEAVDFGRVVVGESATAPLTIDNLNGGPFDVTSGPFLGGTDPGDFAVVTAPPAAVPSSQSVTGELRFSPQQVGSRSGQISAMTDWTPELTATLSGIGVAPGSLSLSVDPSQLAFGPLTVGASKTLSLTLTNGGIDSAPIQPLEITGADSSVFALAGQTVAAPAPLAPGASLQIAVTFAPPAQGDDSATLEIQGCRLCTPIAVPLSGTGTAFTVAFEPSSVSFPPIPREQSSTSPMALVNVGGNSSATIDAMTWEGGVAPFSVVFPPDAGLPGDAGRFPITLAPGQRLDFEVVYAPALSEAPGEVDQATLVASVSGVSGASPQASLTGTVGTYCHLDVPGKLFFGYAVPPYYDPAQTLTLTNSGPDACSVSQLAFASGSDPGFQFQAPAVTSLVVPGNGTASVPMIFAPADSSDPWLRTGTLTMQSTDPAHPSFRVGLSGYTQDTPYAKGSPWPRWCHDNGNSCLSTVDTSKTGPNRRWRTLLTGGAPGPFGFSDWGAPFTGGGPTIGANGVIYVSTSPGLVAAIDSNTGGFVWPSFAAVTESGVPGPFPGSFYGFLGGGLGASWVMGPGLSVPSVGADGRILVYAEGEYFGLALDGGDLYAAPGLPVGTPDFLAAATGPFVRPDGLAMLSLMPEFDGGSARDDGPSGVLTYSQGTLVASQCPACYGNGVVAPDGTSYWAGLVDSGMPSGAVSGVIQILADGGIGFTAPTFVACGGTQVPVGGPPPVPFFLESRGADSVVGLGGGGVAAFPAAFEPAVLRGSELYLSSVVFLPDAGTITALGVFNVDASAALEWRYCDFNDFAGSVEALGPDGGVILSTEYIGPPDAGAVGLDGGVPIGHGFVWVDPPGVVRWQDEFPVEPNWAYDLQGCAVGAEGTIYFTSENSSLVALNGSNGDVLWTYGPVSLSSTAFEDIVTVAFPPDAGAPGMGGPIIGSDGTIYFVDYFGYLNAVR
jgi:outer membrane protein assembly factor BamB